MQRTNTGRTRNKSTLTVLVHIANNHECKNENENTYIIRLENESLWSVLSWACAEGLLVYYIEMWRVLYTACSRVVSAMRAFRGHG